MRTLKKLKLKKEVIALISDAQMKGLRGGYYVDQTKTQPTAGATCNADCK